MSRFPNKTAARWWLAGIIDGEGSVGRVSHGKRNPALRYVSITNTDPGIIEAIEEVYRLLGVTYYRRERKWTNPKWSTAWTIDVNGRENLLLLEDIPLQGNKAGRITALIQSYKLHRPRRRLPA